MLRQADKACQDWRRAAALGMVVGNRYVTAAGCAGPAAEEATDKE